MLYTEIIAVCSEIHTKYGNTLCGQRVAFLIVKPGDTVQKPLGFKSDSIAWELPQHKQTRCTDNINLK